MRSEARISPRWRATDSMRRTRGTSPRSPPSSACRTAWRTSPACGRTTSSTRSAADRSADGKWRLTSDLAIGQALGQRIGDGGTTLSLARQRAVLDEPCSAAGGHAAEQLVDLEPEQRDEGLAAGVGQVRAPARSADPEHPVLVDPDDGPDRGSLAPLQPGEGAVEIGGGEALLGEQGPGLQAVRRVEPVARAFEQA